MTFGYRERTSKHRQNRRGSPSATGQTGAAKPPEFVSVAQRAAALRRTQVWRTPPVPISKADLKRNPKHLKIRGRRVGRMPHRHQADGRHDPQVRLRAGRQGSHPSQIRQGNPELHAEVAATRLLSALGFGADRMYAVEKVRCAGCTSFPFHSLRCPADTGIEKGCFPGGVDYSSASEFHAAVIERRLEGRRIESKTDEGWAWHELNNVSESHGGAPRAHVDALKLWPSSSRTGTTRARISGCCAPGGLADGGCSRPFAIIQDLGASFGPPARSAQLAIVRRLDRSTHVPCEHGTAAVGRRDFSHANNLGRRPRFPVGVAGAAGEQTTPGSLQARRSSRPKASPRRRRPEAWAAAFEDKIDRYARRTCQP